MRNREHTLKWRDKMAKYVAILVKGERGEGRSVVGVYGNITLAEEAGDKRARIEGMDKIKRASSQLPRWEGCMGVDIMTVEVWVIQGDV
jgi:hypothetical protein